jgi:hypothetical protein
LGSVLGSVKPDAIGELPTWRLSASKDKRKKDRDRGIVASDRKSSSKTHWSSFMGQLGVTRGN